MTFPACSAGMFTWSLPLSLYGIPFAIHSGSGLTVLLVEQRVAEALHYADRGYVLEAGRVVLEGSHDELKSNDRIRQAYLGM